MMYEEYLTAFDILMENANDLIRNFNYAVMTEASDAASVDDAKESILKTIWKAICKATVAICDWVRKKVHELRIYIKNKFYEINKTTVLLKDITISGDAEKGVPSIVMNTFKSAMFNLKSNATLNSNDMDKIKDKLSIIDEYTPVKQTYPKGTKFHLRAIELNMYRLDKMAEDVKKSIAKIDDKFTKKLTSNAELAKKYFNEIQIFLTKYRNYLTSIIGDIDTIIKNCAMPPISVNEA